MVDLLFVSVWKNNEICWNCSKGVGGGWEVNLIKKYVNVVIKAPVQLIYGNKM
jgi:hypothetical protein